MNSDSVVRAIAASPLTATVSSEPRFFLGLSRISTATPSTFPDAASGLSIRPIICGTLT
jgi:hypothetical protein